MIPNSIEKSQEKWIVLSRTLLSYSDDSRKLLHYETVFQEHIRNESSLGELCWFIWMSCRTCFITVNAWQMTWEVKRLHDRLVALLGSLRRNDWLSQVCKSDARTGIFHPKSLLLISIAWKRCLYVRCVWTTMLERNRQKYGSFGVLRYDFKRTFHFWTWTDNRMRYEWSWLWCYQSI